MLLLTCSCSCIHVVHIHTPRHIHTQNKYILNVPLEYLKYRHRLRVGVILFKGMDFEFKRVLIQFCLHILLMKTHFYSQGKPDLNTTLPIRQTASIFKQPVTKVTNHPNNKVKSDPQRVNEQPRQVRDWFVLQSYFAENSGSFTRHHSSKFWLNWNAFERKFYVQGSYRE